MAKQPPAPTGP